jgi:hypothetical protein
MAVRIVSAFNGARPLYEARETIVKLCFLFDLKIILQAQRIVNKHRV